jgi:2-polyprenyl-3-methyl-5-hydroxy-6-metoxy-1,4-benzoquinol methylase
MVRQNITQDQFVKEDLELMNSAINYIDYQYNYIYPFIGNDILEVGGGIGNITKKIIRVDNQITVVEPNHFCVERLKSRLANHQNIDIIENYFDTKLSASLANRNFDTILCINVLEHIDDDEMTIKLFRHLISKEGNVVLIVPAHTWAFGEIDKAVGHFRRYNQKVFFQLLRSKGFKIKFWRYFNVIGLLGWAVNARILKITSQNTSQIKLFDKYFIPIQRKIESIFRFPFGQSLLVVLQGGEE